jgi:hypothetical protein
LKGLGVFIMFMLVSLQLNPHGVAEKT